MLNVLHSYSHLEKEHKELQEIYLNSLSEINELQDKYLELQRKLNEKKEPKILHDIKIDHDSRVTSYIPENEKYVMKIHIRNTPTIPIVINSEFYVKLLNAIKEAGNPLNINESERDRLIRLEMYEEVIKLDEKTKKMIDLINKCLRDGSSQRIAIFFTFKS